jgi:hypothetical protein
MSTLKTNNVQVGQSATATNNFTLYQPATPDGTVRLGVGNAGATTSDVITATNAGNVTIAGTLTAAAVVGGLPGGQGQAFTSSGTFTIPTGITAIKMTIVGGGGAGGSTSSSGTQGGGGGGGAAIKFLTGLTPGNTLTVTVGAAAGTSSVASGTQSITTVSATGGANATNNNFLSAVGGTGGVGSNGDLNIGGTGGGGGFGISDGCTFYVLSGTGGSSILGGGGAAVTDGNGNAGRAYGGGGGGSASAVTSRSSGAGAAGVVLIEW